MLGLLIRRSNTVGARVLALASHHHHHLPALGQSWAPVPGPGPVRHFANKKGGEIDEFDDDAADTDLSMLVEPPGEGFEDETYGDDLDRLTQVYDNTMKNMKTQEAVDRDHAMIELKKLKAEMSDPDKILSEDWVLNPDNGVYYNPETQATKVPYEKSMKEFKKRRAARSREDLTSAVNDSAPDFITPRELHPTGQLWTAEEMDHVRRKYHFLDFKKLGKALDTADSHYFTSPAKPNMIRWGPDIPEDGTAQYQPDWDDEGLKFLGLLPVKYHVATMRCVHGTTVGKKHSYGSLVIGGNGKGWAGFGYGKGLSPDDATRRAALALRKNLTDIPLDESRTICQSRVGRHGRVKVIMNRCLRGHGVVAGPLVMSIMECIGVHDISTKVVGSRIRNPLHVVYAVFKGLTSTTAPRQLALDRGVNFYKQFDPAVREPPPTRDQMKARTQSIRDYIQTADQLWRKRVDLSGGDGGLTPAEDDNILSSLIGQEAQVEGGRGR